MIHWSILAIHFTCIHVRIKIIHLLNVYFSIRSFLKLQLNYRETILILSIWHLEPHNEPLRLSRANKAGRDRMDKGESWHEIWSQLSRDWSVPNLLTRFHCVLFGWHRCTWRWMVKCGCIHPSIHHPSRDHVQVVQVWPYLPCGSSWQDLGHGNLLFTKGHGKVHGCLFGSFFMFSNFYWLDLHPKQTRVALVNLRWYVCKNWIETHTSLYWLCL